MGRPPIGERAMTAAEKQRRYRERKRRAAYGNSEPVTEPRARAAAGDGERVSALQRENAQLRARIAELEAAFARERPAGTAGEKPFRPVPRDSAAWVKVKRTSGTGPAKEPPPPMPETEAVAKLERQLKAARTQIRNLRGQLKWATAEADRNTRLVMSKRLHRHIKAALHPDRAPQDAAAQRRWTALAQEFNGLKAELLDDEG
jgi:hypothetical protein